MKKLHSFWNFPNIIIISFKRFSADGTSKMQHNIDPFKNFDLCKYVRGYNKETFIYNLFGICNHVGGVKGDIIHHLLKILKIIGFIIMMIKLKRKRRISNYTYGILFILS